MLKKELEAKVKEQEAEIKALKEKGSADLEQRARVMEALLKYASYHWIADIEAISVAADEALKKIRGSAAKRLIQDLAKRFPKEKEGYLARLWNDGVALPLDEELLQILGEGLVINIEKGSNGLMLTVKRNPISVEDKIEEGKKDQ